MVSFLVEDGGLLGLRAMESSIDRSVRGFASPTVFMLSNARVCCVSGSIIKGLICLGVVECPIDFVALVKQLHQPSVCRQTCCKSCDAGEHGVC